MIVPVVYIPSVMTGSNFEASAFGLEVTESTKEPFLAFYISALLSLSAAVAYGILWGKNWAIDVGIAYGVLAALTSLCSMLLPGLRESGTHISIEAFILIPFIWCLAKKRREWMRFNTNALAPETKQSEPDGVSN